MTAANDTFRDIERTFIAGVLRNPHVTTKCEEVLNTSGGDAFLDILSQQAWDAICELDHSGTSITANAVRVGMVTQGAAAQQAQQYVVDRQAEDTVLDGDTLRAAEKVRDGMVIRAVSASAQDVLAVCGDPRTDAVAAMGAMNDAVNAVSSASVTTSDIMQWGDSLLPEAFDQILARADGDLPGISTGSRALDSMTGGLCGGQLFIVGARPRVGKSVSLIDFGRAALRQGVGVIHFSMEMPRHEIMGRYIAAEASIDGHAIRTGRLTESDKQRFFKATKAIPWENLVIIDKPSISTGQLSAITRQVHREFQRRGVTQMVGMADYLQLFGSDSTRGRREVTRQQFLGEVCVGLKSLAMELDMPWVVPAQLGRSAGRERRPEMEDLRESGDIENAADVVLLLHRPDAADADDRPGEIDYLLVKHRQDEAPQEVTRTHALNFFRTHDMAYASDIPPEGVGAA